MRVKGSSVFVYSTLLALASVLKAVPASGQEGPFGFQIRTGATLPVASFREGEGSWAGRSGGGTTIGMGFTFPLYAFVGGYMGFSQHRFACDDTVCPAGKDWISTGFDASLRIVMGRRALRGWVQGGVHTHRIEGRIRAPVGVKSLASEGGGGYEVGGGVLVKVGRRTSLSPGVRFGLGNVPFPARSTMGLRYLVFDLGLVLGF